MLLAGTVNDTSSCKAVVEIRETLLLCGRTIHFGVYNSAKGQEEVWLIVFGVYLNGN